MVVAHAGHVLVDTLLYGTPMVILGVAMWWSTRKEKQRQRESSDGPASPSGGPASA
jgi:prolipoprotein diacylglyceryltransferase